MLQKKQWKIKWVWILAVCLLSFMLVMGYPSITHAATINEGQTEEQAINLESQDEVLETQSNVYTSGDWRYLNINDGCYITKYTGNASVVTIPSELNGMKVTAIGDSPFDGNTSITKIIVPSTVKHILYINNVPNLTEIVLNEGLFCIDGLRNNPKLTKINLPSSVYLIDNYVFENTPINLQSWLSSDFKYYGGYYYRANSVVLNGTRYYDKANELLQAVNSYRASNGLSALTMDASYTELAMVRAAEQDIYVGHTRPTGISVGIYENVASGLDSANSVVNAWKNSYLHNAALLTTDYSSCGIGVWKNSVNGTYQWVIDFKSVKSSDLSTQNSEQNINQTIEYNKDNSYNDFFTHSISGTTSLKVGNTAQLTHVIKNSNDSLVSSTNAVSTWTSSNNNVASVDKKTGKLTAKKAGTAVITATSGTTVSKTTVTVKANSTTPTNPADSSKVTMYRLYNPNSGEHFYTANVNEKNHIVSLGWKDEGVGWTAPKSGDPVYRLYNKNGGEHHYTLSQSERNNLMRLGWSYEGIGWYSDKNKSVPLYRQYNPNAFANNHNYTTSKSENNWLVSLGWKAEGIGWYGVK